MLALETFKVVFHYLVLVWPVFRHPIFPRLPHDLGKSLDILVSILGVVPIHFSTHHRSLSLIVLMPFLDLL